jgi:hypothetical protein
MSMNSPLRVAPGVVVEQVGIDLLVVAPGSSDVVKLDGSAADVFRAIEAGRPITGATDIIENLQSAGIIETPAAVSRRSLIRVGTLGVGAGFAVLSMPGVAMASSRPEPDTSDSGGSNGGGGSDSCEANWGDREPLQGGYAIINKTDHEFGLFFFTQTVPDVGVLTIVSPANHPDVLGEAPSEPVVDALDLVDGYVVISWTLSYTEDILGPKIGVATINGECVTISFGS